MTETTILTIFVAVTAVAVVMQMAILAGMYSAMRKMQAQVDAMQKKVDEHALPLLAKLREFVDDGAPKMQTVLSNLAETSALVRLQAEKIDVTMTEITTVARTQAARAGSLAERTMVRVDRVAETLQHTVLMPARQIAAVMEGVMAAVGQLMGSRRGGAPKAGNEDMFI